MRNVNEIKNLKDKFLEKGGRFQIFLIIILSLNVMSFGTINTIGVFYTHIPKFHCNGDENSICTVGNTTTECQKFKFDPLDDITVGSEFSLVCRNEYIGTLTNSLYFGGVAIGSLLCCILCDKFGRKKLVLICMYAIVFLSICLYFGNSLTLFIILRMVLGIFAGGLEMCTFTLIIEYSPSKCRTGAIAFFEINWTFGLMILGGVAYIIHSWRILTIVMTIPLILSIAYSWLIPESILWLYVNKKYHECIATIKKIAKKNQDNSAINACTIVLQNLENDIALANFMETYDTDGDGLKTSSGIRNVFRSPILKKHLIIMITIWLSATLSYYGIAHYLPNFSGQRHMNFIIEAAAENLGYISSYFVFSRFGRRIPLTFYQILTGILLIFVYFIDKSGLKDWSAIALMLLARTLVASDFSGMYVYASELFPTTCRGFVLGLFCFAARIARAFDSYYWFLDEIIPEYLPMTIIALLATVSGITTMLLPETSNTIFPNTVEEAHDIWKKPE